jgi:hypothetical protein
VEQTFAVVAVLGGEPPILDQENLGIRGKAQWAFFKPFRKELVSQNEGQCVHAVINYHGALSFGTTQA